MPTSYTDQFFVIDPGNPPATGASLRVVTLDFTDQDGNGFISPFGADTVDGRNVTSVWVDDMIQVRMGGARVWITGVTFYTDGGPAVFTPTDGKVLEDATFRRSTFVNNSTQVSVGDFGPPCFAAGTRILTPLGPRAVETLEVGDLVETLDEGPQPIRWRGHRSADGTGDFAPIRFAPGALGNRRPLLVSPQHRILIRGWRAELFAGEDEVLVAARHLAGSDLIARAPCGRVSYHHLMFDRHQIVEAEGVPTESFHPGDWILATDTALRRELRSLFPDLDGVPSAGGPVTARTVMCGAEARLMAA